MAKVPSVQTRDVRIRLRDFRIMTGPAWAYRRTEDGWKPIPEAWQRLVELIQEARAMSQARRLAKAAEWFKDHDKDFEPGPPEPPLEVRLPPFCDWLLPCRGCGEPFARVPKCRARYCCEACRTRHRVRPSAAIERPDRRCEHCGYKFTPSRADARYCSGACRTAAHRAR